MSDPLTRLRRFLRELERREVYRVAAVSAAVAWLVIEVRKSLFQRGGALR
jgi:hypothetical protein